MQIKFFFLLFIFFLSPLLAQESALDSSVKRLEWEASPGAQYYVVEIEQEGLIIHTLETENNFIPLFLNPGEYKLRISAYNKFRKQASQSDWSPLTVFPSIQPVIENIEPSVVILDNEELLIEIEGTDFDENGTFYLIYRDSRIEGRVLKKNISEGKDHYRVSFSKTNMSPADWDLLLINPSGKKYIKKEALRIERYSLPHIDSLSHSIFYTNKNNGVITITGKNFSPEIDLLINGEKSNALTVGQVFFEKEIIFQINTFILEEGSYDLSVMNDTGLISNKWILLIENPPLTSEEKSKMVRKKSNFSLGLSYRLAFPLDEGRELFDTSPISLAVIFRSKFDNPSLYKFPILRNIGFYGDLDFTHYSLKKEGVYEDFIFSGNLGLYYLSVSDKPYNILVSVGLGPAYSFFLFEDYRVRKSFDLSSNFSLAMVYNKDSIIMEGGFNFSTIQYQYNTFSMIKPYFLYGWEF